MTQKSLPSFIAAQLSRFLFLSRRALTQRFFTSSASTPIQHEHGDACRSDSQDVVGLDATYTSYVLALSLSQDISRMLLFCYGDQLLSLYVRC